MYTVIEDSSIMAPLGIFLLFTNEEFFGPIEVKGEKILKIFFPLQLFYFGQISKESLVRLVINWSLDLICGELGMGKFVVE